MSLTLYELGNKTPRHSLFSWRTVMALAHKGLPYDSVRVKISDKAAIAFSGQEKVPIIKDGDKVVSDSWKIAEHLEAAYPQQPSLFGGERGHAYARFVNLWADRQLVPRLASMIIIDVLSITDAADGAHLRKVMEAAFKRSLEELSANREKDIESFRRLLDPARAMMRTQSFLSGATPAYPDYILFSLFQWARIITKFELLESSDALSAWRERMLDLFGGLARGEPARA